VHNFLEQIVANIRGQAAFLQNVIAKQNAIYTWQKKTEDEMKVVQQAGNTLSEKVEQIGQLSLRSRMEQEEINGAVKKTMT
jgi:hypothetical protein